MGRRMLYVMATRSYINHSLDPSPFLSPHQSTTTPTNQPTSLAIQPSLTSYSTAFIACDKSYTRLFLVHYHSSSLTSLHLA